MRRRHTLITAMAAVAVLVSIAPVHAPLVSALNPKNVEEDPRSLLSTGGNFICAISPSGGAKCMGDNYYGQIGNGGLAFWNDEAPYYNRLKPSRVRGLSRGVKAVAAGGSHACALLKRGAVLCWGDNYDGQLGDGTRKARSIPKGVKGLEKGIVGLAVGNRHTCALTKGGGVKCWGNRQFGGIGDNTRLDDLMTYRTLQGNPRTTPVNVYGLSTGVSAISAGGDSTCAVTKRGLVKCWGYNRSGQLGDGSHKNRSRPVTVKGLRHIVSIAVGDDHACAVNRSGGVKCWGNNFDGQLGLGFRDEVPFRGSSIPVTPLGLESGFSAVAASNLTTCALTTGGSVKCWGEGASGQLGIGPIEPDVNNVLNTNFPAPVDVIGLPGPVRAIQTGGATCALMMTGNIYCWGSGWPLGLGDPLNNIAAENAMSPMEILGLNS